MISTPQERSGLDMTRFNPPGLDALSYRGASYQTSLSRMLAGLRTETVQLGDDRLLRPLADLNVEADDDWTVALLHAWAVVADVLSFYQERIINEGYLRTATERRSVLELARSIGYELPPGVAASTHLAFTVQVGRDEPPRQVDVPANTAVQGMSPSAQLPQVFETSQAFTAHSDWNVLRLASDDRSATIWPGTTSVRLAGDRLNLQLGDPILIIGGAGSADDPERRWLLATLAQVEADPQNGCTVVSWERTIGTLDVDTALHNATLFSLREVGGLFPYTQAAVDYRSDAGDRWWPAGIGLPHTAVHTLVMSSSGQLFAGTSQDVFRSVDQGESWQPARTGSLRRQVTALAADEGRALYAGSDEGHIYLSQDDGHHWTAMSGEAVVQSPRRLRKWLPSLFKGPLPKATVRSLVISPRRGKHLLVAATDDGVFRSRDQGKTWRPVNASLPGLDWRTGRTKMPVRALALTRTGGRDHLFAGTDAGVFRVKDGPRLWPLLMLSVMLVLALRAFSSEDKGSLLAHLLSWAQSAGKALSNVLDRLPEPLIQPLQKILGPVSDLISGLPNTWPNLHEPWDRLDAPLTWLIDFLLVATVVALLVLIVRSIDRFITSRPRISIGVPVRALAVGANGSLFAGTEDGVYRSPGANPRQHGGRLGRLLSHLKGRLLQDFGRRWRLVTDETVQDVRTLATSPVGAILAGTGTGELFRSDGDGETWHRFDEHMKLADVQAILATEHDHFAAGKPVTNETERRWSLSQVAKGRIDLGPGGAALAAGRWVVLRQGDDADVAKPCQVLETTIVSGHDANQAGPFVRLAVDPTSDVAAFDRETTTVWAEDEALVLCDDQPVWGDRFTLDRVLPGLAPTRSLVFSGKRTRVRVADHASPLSLTSADSLRSVPLLAGDVLHLMSAPHPVDPADEALVRWHLRNRNGFVGFIAAGSEAFVPLPAEEGDEIVAEVALIASVGHGQRATQITLHTPLENAYDRASLTIYGNVMHATHGRTVQDEVLGSGDASQANQRFRLRQGPLTFLSAPTASGVEASLKVQVNGVTWHQVSFLEGLDPDRRAYVVRQDARGHTTIIFGDGHQGARPPSGREQITATYRVGMGPEANVPPGSLNQLQSALQGIESVTNPLPATGGAGPEKLARGRRDAPGSVRGAWRIVSLADYEDFVHRFPGIGKAQARLLHAGPQDVLHLTVADEEGQPIPKTSDLHRALVQAIADNRGEPEPRVHVDAYEPVYFNLRAKVLIDPDHGERCRAIEASLRNAVRRAFAFEARAFGQDVSASALISLMQDTAGVVAVQLVHLHRSTENPRLSAVLRASPARWREGRLLPAQMLVVNADGGVKLILEVAA